MGMGQWVVTGIWQGASPASYRHNFLVFRIELPWLGNPRLQSKYSMLRICLDGICSSETGIVFYGRTDIRTDDGKK